MKFLVNCLKYEIANDLWLPFGGVVYPHLRRRSSVDLNNPGGSRQD